MDVFTEQGSALPRMLPPAALRACSTSRRHSCFGRDHGFRAKHDQAHHPGPRVAENNSWVASRTLLDGAFLAWRLPRGIAPMPARPDGCCSTVGSVLRCLVQSPRLWFGVAATTAATRTVGMTWGRWILAGLFPGIPSASTSMPSRD